MIGGIALAALGALAIGVIALFRLDDKLRDWKRWRRG